MRRLTVFNSISLDGFFTDPNGDMRWTHSGPDDAEWTDYVRGNASGGGALMFGRVTYDMMARFWPSPMATERNAVVAARMNAMPKFVVSRTLDEATWNNTRLLKGEAVEQVTALKSEPGEDIVILGSGSIVSQLAAAGLIDEFTFVIVPTVLGAGRTPFQGVETKIQLQRTGSRSFNNGNVVLTYVPA